MWYLLFALPPVVSDLLSTDVLPEMGTDCEVSAIVVIVDMFVNDRKQRVVGIDLVRVKSMYNKQHANSSKAGVKSESVASLGFHRE